LSSPTSSSDAPELSKLPAVSATASKSTRQVLLVEDDLISAKAMAGILRTQGLEIVTVRKVKDALDALRARSFQYLVLDLMLPDGEGTAVLREVRDRNLDLHVCIVTAANDTALLDRVNALRPECLLRKPIDMAELLGGLNLTQ
jgi:DNA-binding response OmpR family regulator